MPDESDQQPDQVMVYKYGTPSWVTLPAEVEEQLFLAHQLREDLVTLQHNHEEATQAVWSSYPAVAETEQALSAIEDTVAELAETVNKERSKQRTRTPKTPAARDLREAKAKRRNLRQARRDAIAEVRNDTRARQRLDDLAAEHKAAVKRLYTTYCKEGVARDERVQDANGDWHTETVHRRLYWATFNDITRNHRTEVQRVHAQRNTGRAATLRHHRWDGSGRITVQLQRQASDPPRTPDLIASGQGRWRNVLILQPWVEPTAWAARTRAQQRRDARGTVTLNVGSGRTVELPVIVHRMLPRDVDIAEARLVVRRTASKRQVYLTVTAKMPHRPPADQSGPAMAVHFGWRRISEAGDLRVATWHATAPVTVPDHLTDVVQADTDRSGLIILSGQWRNRLEHYKTIRSERDKKLDEIRDELVAYLRAHPLPDDEDVTAATVAKWRAPHRFARLAQRWRHNPPGGSAGAQMADRLETWRRLDKKAWEKQAHGRTKVLADREDTWHRVAAWISDTAGTVVLDDTNFSQVTQRRAPQNEDQPTQMQQRAAAQRVDAAPGGLRETIRQTAERDGTNVTVVPHKGISRTHDRCGHVNPADERYGASTLVVCDGCGQTYDQDRSATLTMLAASGHDSSRTTGTARGSGGVS